MTPATTPRTANSVYPIAINHVESLQIQEYKMQSTTTKNNNDFFSDAKATSLEDLGIGEGQSSISAPSVPGKGGEYGAGNILQNIALM